MVSVTTHGRHGVWNPSYSTAYYNVLGLHKKTQKLRVIVRWKWNPPWDVSTGHW